MAVSLFAPPRMRVAFVIVAAGLFLLPALGGAAGQHNQDSPQDREAAAEARVFWRPRTVEQNSLFGALEDFGRRADENRVLRSRGLVRPLSFRYKSFSYERDFFHVYKGFRLRSFMDGKLDLGLYKHHVQRGMMFGPAGAFLPSGSNRIELNLRWNLNEPR